MKSTDFQQSPKMCIGEKIVFSTNGAGKTGFPPAED
jgi:hypothetical protein